MRRKWVPIGGLLLLSLLWAVGWVRADLVPGRAASEPKLSALHSQAALLGVFAVLAATAGAIGKRRWPRGHLAGKAVLAGIGLFVAPAVLTAICGAWIDDTTRVALFSLTPLFAVVLEPHLGMGEQTREIRGGIAAAMVAGGGTFLVFPFDLPRSYAAAGAVLGAAVAAASVAAPNCVGVEVVQKRGVCPLTFAAVSAGSASVLLGLAGFLFRQGETATVPVGLWALPDLLALALLFWLMRHMSAVQMTTRFLIAPLMANLISLVLLRPHVEVQAWIGLLLIALGSGWMVFARAGSASGTAGMLNLQ